MNYESYIDVQRLIDNIRHNIFDKNISLISLPRISKAYIFIFCLTVGPPYNPLSVLRCSPISLYNLPFRFFFSSSFAHTRSFSATFWPTYNMCLFFIWFWTTLLVKEWILVLWCFCSSSIPYETLNFTVLGSFLLNGLLICLIWNLIWV